MKQLRHTSDDADLGDSLGVTENDTDLRGSSTLTGQSADLLLDLGGSGLEPRGSSARVGKRRSGYSLSVGVKTTHCGRFGCRLLAMFGGRKLVVKM